ncbi:MAG: S41 family peptidase [Betaproteobacteria bacterium]
MVRQVREARAAAIHLAAAVTVCAAGAGAVLCAQTGISANDQTVVRDMLHQVRDDLEKNYYDRAFHGVDVRARFDDAERRLKAASNIDEATAIVAESLLQLDDSHTVFIPPDRSIKVDYGWKMAMIGDAALVVDVSPGSDAARQGLEPGDRVLRLNRFEPTRANLWQLAYLYRFIEPQVQQHLIVRTPEGTERTLDVRSRVTKRGTLPIDALVDELLNMAGDILDREAPVGPDVLVWKMPVFGSPDQVDEAVGKARGHKALVLDLRGNGGGAVTALRELVSRSFDRQVLLAVERRRGRERREVARPARHPFGGTLVVLVDSRSASAAEMFARIVQLERRGRVVGDRTAGAVMTSRFFPHSIGLGAVAFYATSITVGDVRMSDGGSLEKVGVTPDEAVLPTPQDLAAGRDPALARAVELAGGRISPEDAGRLFADR